MPGCGDAEKPLTRKKIDDATLDAIERDYIAGMSTYDIGDKYGLYHSTISKQMKKRGHVRGKGWAGGCKGCNKGHETQRLNAIKKLKDKLAEESGGSIELVEYTDNTHIRLKCNVCGSVFEHGRVKWRINCPVCQQKETAEVREERLSKREAEREQKRIEREAEYAKEKICASCGSVFHSEYETQLYCSETCVRREKRHRKVAEGKMKLKSYSNHRKRAREYGVAYEPGITTKKLIERDGNICKICGSPCDSNDTRWGYCGPYYPTIDHIVAIANGGSHTWDNVQLAHFICNSNKRDLDMSEVSA